MRTGTGIPGMEQRGKRFAPPWPYTLTPWPAIQGAIMGYERLDSKRSKEKRNGNTGT